MLIILQLDGGREHLLGLLTPLSGRGRFSGIPTLLGDDFRLFQEPPDEPVADFDDADEAESGEEADSAAGDAQLLREAHLDVPYDLHNVGLSNLDDDRGVVPREAILAVIPPVFQFPPNVVGPEQSIRRAYEAIVKDAPVIRAGLCHENRRHVGGHVLVGTQ